MTVKVYSQEQWRNRLIRTIFLCVFTCVTFLIGFVYFYLPVYADEYQGKTEADFNGKGTQFDPYLISSYDDLCLVHDLVDAGNGLYGKYLRQTDDIIVPNGVNWNGIGEVTEWKAFGGIYDGNGHTISSLNCNEPFAGLFSALDGQIWNLGIESGIIAGDCAGSITSHGTANAKIINCYNKAEVSGNVRAGGITDNCPATIMFCINLGEISGTSESAISAGINSFENANIMYCYSKAKTGCVVPEIFQGKIDSTYSGIDMSIDEFMALYEKGMWDAYCYSKAENEYSYDKEKEYAIKKAEDADYKVPDAEPGSRNYYCMPIKRGTIEFQRLEGESLTFDNGYQPKAFISEKDKKREEFKNLYEHRFDFTGEGTPESPFQICSYADLCWLRDCVNCNVTYYNYYFEGQFSR